IVAFQLLETCVAHRRFPFSLEAQAPASFRKNRDRLCRRLLPDSGCQLAAQKSGSEKQNCYEDVSGKSSSLSGFHSHSVSASRKALVCFAGCPPFIITIFLFPPFYSRCRRAGRQSV